MTREEAIKVAYGIPVTKAQHEALQFLIPELAESEDERMLREIKRYIKEQGDKPTGLSNGTVAISDMIAWLEKQKEQKPWKVGANAYFTPEQKPAESISQTTVQGKGVYKICPRCKERMVRDDSMVYTSMPPQYRYECPKCGESECDTVMYDNPEMEEQRPVDYEAELKKCKDNPLYFYDKYVSIKQKPADLSEMMVHKEPYVAPVPTPMVADEQKPEWSESDKQNINLIISYLDSYIEEHNDTFGADECKSLKYWLKSLPERFNLQPQQEWSEKEYGRLFDIEHYLDGTLQLSPDRRIACIDFLKSLRSQSHWKPSKEQMEVLKDYADSAIDSQRDIEGNILFSLYDDLEKLM